MNGQNSVTLDKYNSIQTCYYIQSVLKGYKSWVGFSATFSTCGRECTYANFPECIFLNINTISEKAIDNGLVAYYKYNEINEKFDKIKQAIEAQLQCYRNYIVILEDKNEAKLFYEYYPKPQGKQYLLINEFGQFMKTMG